LAEVSAVISKMAGVVYHGRKKCLSFNRSKLD
jgi:hypothetical protein